VLRGGELDVGLMRERAAGEDFDAMLVLRENLGVLLASELAAGLIGPDGVRLDALSGLQWLGFPRSNGRACHDELTAILRSHGIDIGPPPPEDQLLRLARPQSLHHAACRSGADLTAVSSACARC
jgi:hypothetical protein